MRKIELSLTGKDQDESLEKGQALANELAYGKAQKPGKAQKSANKLATASEQASESVDSQRLTHVSKFLSLILRHKPETIGIALDQHGWANIDELLEKMQPHFPITRSLLEQIVRTDSKQRYAISDDGRCIRANQGHSIAVDVELTPMQPPQVLFHGTATRFAASIEAQGLLHQGRLYTHLSKDVVTAQAVGQRHGKPVVYQVDAQRMVADGFVFYQSANGVWLTKHVPPQYLQRLEN